MSWSAPETESDFLELVDVPRAIRANACGLASTRRIIRDTIVLYDA